MLTNSTAHRAGDAGSGVATWGDDESSSYAVPQSGELVVLSEQPWSVPDIPFDELDLFVAKLALLVRLPINANASPLEGPLQGLVGRALTQAEKAALTNRLGIPATNAAPA